jgi:hypothetical protein
VTRIPRLAEGVVKSSQQACRLEVRFLFCLVGHPIVRIASKEEKTVNVRGQRIDRESNFLAVDEIVDDKGLKVADD